MAGSHLHEVFRAVGADELQFCVALLFPTGVFTGADYTNVSVKRFP